MTEIVTLQPPLTPARQGQRQRLMAHRRARSLSLGPCMRLQFEDALTLRHQIQEVLRAECVSSAEGLQQEIDTYAHLLPDGSNWKATLMLELPDAHQRRRELPLLNDAAHQVYVELPGQPRVHAHANEDQPDRHRGRLSGVHFLRFQFAAPCRAALQAGSPARLGCAHPQYEFRRVIPRAALDLLRRDLTPAVELAP
ncbi:MAG TPA: DUF3501 family protein [Burkholderiaceae bacterium]|nr:DUF3501 family protein [Burkholderiaceae bacterium]